MIYLINGDALVVNNLGGLAARSHVSYADIDGTTVTAGRSNLSSSATTFNAIAFSAAGTRNVRIAAVTNYGAIAGTFRFQHSDGTVATNLHSAVLQPGQTLCYNEGAGFTVSSAESATLTTLTLPDVPTPDVPAPGFGTVFMKQVAGRMMTAQIGPSGLDTTLQPHLGGNKIGLWLPPGGSTTVPGVIGMATLAGVGTATARTVAITNILTRMTRLGYVSAATAASLAGVREAAAKFTTGAGNGLGGFFVRYRFGVSDAASVIGARMFVGLSTSTSAPTNVEPSNLINSVGVAQLSTSDNLQIVYSNATVKTPINLGVNFPANSNGNAYELALFAPNTGGVYYQLDRLNTAFTAKGFLPSTDTPISTTLLCHQLWRTNNAQALAVGLDVCSIYIETDY